MSNLSFPSNMTSLVVLTVTQSLPELGRIPAGIVMFVPLTWKSFDSVGEQNEILMHKVF